MDKKLWLYGLFLFSLILLLLSTGCSPAPMSTPTKKSNLTQLPTRISTGSSNQVRTPTPQSSQKSATQAVGQSPNLPDVYKNDKKSYAAYQEAKIIMGDPKLSRTEKQQKMKILQRTYGEDVMSTVIRYVPVYDEKSKRLISFDQYMRSFSSEYSSKDGSPLERDPVGAGMRIFFDPSPDTIKYMTGMGMSASEQAAYSRKYQEEQRAKQERLNKLEQDIQKSLSGMQKTSGSSYSTAQKKVSTQASGAVKKAGDAINDFLNGLKP